MFKEYKITKKIIAVSKLKNLKIVTKKYTYMSIVLRPQITQ